MLIDFSLEAVKITKHHASTYAGRILSINRYWRWLRKKQRKKNSPCFVCRTSPADAQFKQKKCREKGWLENSIRGKSNWYLFLSLSYIMQFMALHWHSVLQVLDTLKIWHPMQPGMISFKCFSLFLIKKCEQF